jgi:hypothetical protein
VLDQGEPPSSRAEGCAIRREEIGHALSGAGLPRIGVNFYDAHLDLPKTAWRDLRTRIERMRGVYIDRLDRSVRAVAELVANVDLVKARGARREIEEAFDRLIVRIKTLPAVRRPAHQNLIEQFDVGHQSSVAASMVRRGGWPNFPILHFLGEGRAARRQSPLHRSFCRNRAHTDRHRATIRRACRCTRDDRKLTGSDRCMAPGFPHPGALDRERRLQDRARGPEQALGGRLRPIWNGAFPAINATSPACGNVFSRRLNRMTHARRSRRG